MGGPWEMYQGQGAAQPAPGPSTSLPQPGDPTAYSGATPALQDTPAYLTDQDLMALGLEMGAGRGSASVINQMPGHMYSRNYAQRAGTNEADLKNKQGAIDPLLRRIQDFEDIGTHAGSDVLQKATGPDYTPPNADGSWNPLSHIPQDTASQYYQNWRSVLQHVNPFSDQESYDKAQDANLELHHLKAGVAASFKALPGAGQGGATDQAQRTVDTMLGEAMHAGDAKTFYKILHDAKNILRGFARYSDLPASPDDNYVPKNFGQPPPAAPPPGPQGSAQPPSSAPAGPPPEAIDMLQKNSSAKMRAHFDEVFGPGASVRALNAGR